MITLKKRKRQQICGTIKANFSTGYIKKRKGFPYDLKLIKKILLGIEKEKTTKFSFILGETKKKSTEGLPYSRISHTFRIICSSQQ